MGVRKGPKTDFQFSNPHRQRLGLSSALAQESTPAPRSHRNAEAQRLGGAIMAWTRAKVSSVASRAYFFLIILQIPLFRVPCRSGTCTTPIEVSCSQVIANEIFPPAVVKTLLYPGAFVKALVSSMSLARWDNLLDRYNMTNAKNSSAMVDLQRLEVLAGSYFSVAGAFVGLVKPGRMTLFGVLLVVWGLVKEAFLRKPETTDPAMAVYVYPTFLVALICAFASIKYDVKKVTSRTQTRPVMTPLRSSTKSKLK